MTRTDTRQTAAPSGRARAAQVLAFVGLVAALVGALGPAERVRTSYSWPPKALPAERPERLWYTPLLLVAHRPEVLTASVPCTLPPPLQKASKPLNVLATARNPASADGLAVVRDSDSLTIAVGRRVLTRVPLPDVRTGKGCRYRLRMGDGRWSLEGGPAAVASEEGLAEMPFVSGFLSALDLRSGTPPAIQVRTAVHATRTISLQAAAWTIAVLAVAAALWLVALQSRPRPLEAARRILRAARAHAHPVDAVVAVTLLSWWIFAPAFFDDGWALTRQSMFSSARGFSAYYNSLAANGPIAYELDWAQHWLSQSTSALVVLRLPALFCLAATWVLCRWSVARILDSSVGRTQVVLWSLATSFLVGALAWGMTLRTEPVTALLVAAALACVIRFLERGATAPIAALAVIVPLGLTAHPEGIATLAPVLAAAPKLLGWARSRPAIASTIGASAIAWLAVLAFLGSDLEQRRADADTTALYGNTVAWRYELVRYTSLVDYPWGTPIRRAAVALIAIAVLSLLLWGRRRGRSLLDFPASALALALALFIATPTKQPWHFGALLGLAAVAVASETARFRAQAARSGASWARPFLVVLAATLVIAWSWAPRLQWNAFDLRTLDWTPSYERLLPIATLAAALPLALVAAGWLGAMARGRQERLPEIPWRVASWTAPALAAPLIAFTIAMLFADTAKSDSWTLARQNLDALRGRGGCGLGDGLLVAVPGSAQSSSAATTKERHQPPWMPDPPVKGLVRFALGPTREALSSTPWFELSEERTGIFVAGTPGPSKLDLEWGRRVRGGGVELLGAEEIPADYTSDLGVGAVPWSLVRAGEIASRERRADVLRVTLRTAVWPGATVAVTAPVNYTHEELLRTVRRASSRTLVVPNVLTYFPCLPAPLLADGVVDVPSHIVTTPDGTWVLRDRDTSPFLGVLDLYRLQRLPVVTSDPAREDLAVLVVDRRVPGASVARAVKTEIAS